MLSICRNTIKRNHCTSGFNTGAYQETIGGYGGLHHCLIPQPKHILINRDENGIIATEVFSEQQTSDDVLKF
jgi:arginine decarboxylase